MRPRQVLPGQFYLLTRRCTQRQFILRPDPLTNDIFLYCLAEAAQRFGIVVLLPVAMSNHHHVVCHDPHARINEFTEHFHKMAARSLNALRGRWENLWASEPPCLVTLTDAADVMEKLVYVATNPVKDHLVERAHQWPGVTGLVALLNGRSLTVRRPRQFFREDGAMPESVTLELQLPSQLGDPDEVRNTLRARVAEVEAAAAEERRQSGTPLLGRRAVLAQDWRDTPATIEPRRNLRPRVAAGSAWSRTAALQRNRIFEAAYAEARACWLAGKHALFPAGTYWLRRFAAVPVSPT